MGGKQFPQAAQGAIVLRLDGCQRPAQFLVGVDIARQSALVAVEEIICLTFKIWMVFNQPLKLKLLTSLCQYKEWFLGAIPCKCGDDGDWGEHRKGMG